jgi:hypothetical protein
LAGDPLGGLKDSEALPIRYVVWATKDKDAPKCVMSYDALAERATTVKGRRKEVIPLTN